MAGADPTDALAETMAAASSDETVASSSGDAATAAAGPGLRPDTVVADRYRILRFVAAGGMGEVYEAHDTVLDERVALKTIKREVARHQVAIERFLREIQLARKVTHPSVCRIFDVGFLDEADQVPFLSMEFLAGESLADRIRRGPMTPAEARPIVTQMIAALQAAHRAGVVHRDFKSPNVLLVPEPEGVRAVVTDFGLALSLEAGDAPTTGTGGFVGTPAYMAPEQVEGEPVGMPADVYALGVVLFEMVTGRLPFVADTPLAAAARRLTTPPPEPTSMTPELDPRWSRMIVRCLARRPEDRPGLDVVLAGLSSRSGGARRSRRPAIAAAAGLVAVTAIAVIALALARGGDDRRAAAPPIDAAAPVVVVADAGPPLAPVPSGTPYQQTTGFLLRGELGRARTTAEIAIAREPGDRALRLLLVRTLISLGNAQEAYGHLTLVAHERDQLDAVQLLLLEGYRAEIDGRWADAAAQLQRAYSQVPSVDLGAQLIQALLAGSSGSSADAVLRQLRLAGPPVEAPTLLDYLEVVIRSHRQDFAGVVALAPAVTADAHARGLPALEAQTQNWLALARLHLGEFDATLEAAERARELLIAIDERYLLGETINVLGLAHWHRGELAQARKVYEEGLELQRQTGVDSTTLKLNFAVVAFLSGQHARMRRWMVDVLAMVSDDQRPHVELIAGWERLHAGDVTAATPLLASADAGMNGNDLRMRALIGGLLGERLLLVGDLGNARRQLERALENAAAIDFRPTVTEMRGALAEVAQADGQHDEAVRVARLAIEEADRMQLVPARIRARLVLARALAALGDPGAAAALAEVEALGIVAEDPVLRWTVAIEVAIAARDVEALAAIERDADGGGMPGTAVAAAVARAELTGNQVGRAAALTRARTLGLGLLARRAGAAE